VSAQCCLLCSSSRWIFSADSWNAVSIALWSLSFSSCGRFRIASYPIFRYRSRLPIDASGETGSLSYLSITRGKHCLMIIVTFGFRIPTPSRLGQDYLVINVALFLGNGKEQSLPFSDHAGFPRLSQQESLCCPFPQHIFPWRDGQGISMDEDLYRGGGCFYL